MKVHVEASTEFSIFLSGFLVKMGILGIIRVLDAFDNALLGYSASALALIGLVEGVGRLFIQVDLKRFVAVTTIIETN